jgi:serpin B
MIRSLAFTGTKLVVASMALSVAVSGCDSSSSPSSQNPGVEPPGEFVSSAKQRVTAPDATNDEIAELSRGNTAFALDLYEAIRDQPGNLFYSPFSISIALAMTYAGANTNTETQMADTLRFTLSEERLHTAFNAVDLALSSRGDGAQGQDGEGFRLKVVNATWGKPDYPFLDEYLDVLAVNYGAGMRLLDFANNPEASRIAINEWVEQETEDKIKNLIPRGVITTLTRLVLTNAVYFNAAWASPFEEGSTSDSSFQLFDGSNVSVPMMTQIAEFGYVDGGNYEAIELPYDGGELAMLIVAPTVGTYGEVEDDLSADFIDGVVASLEPRDVNLTMPTFEFDTDVALSKILPEMGMVDAFDPTLSDFSGIDDGFRRDLHITDVLHKAFVAVNEKGTEAAAATAVIVGILSAPQFDVALTLDRPFFFLIRDIETNAVLFFGRVTDPSA